MRWRTYRMRSIVCAAAVSSGGILYIGVILGAFLKKSPQSPKKLFDLWVEYKIDFFRFFIRELFISYCP